MRKRLMTVTVLMGLVVLLLGVTVAAAGVSVYVDNKAVVFPDQGPYIDNNNRTLVPIRFIAEEMGAEVGWDSAKQLVTIDKDKTEIKLTIGERRASVNGAWKTFDTEAVLYNNRTIVPLRFVSETLGADVDWEASIKTVYIWTGKGPKKLVGDEVTPYAGAKPTKTGDWIVSGKPANKRWDNPVIKYATVAELPHELNSLTVMDISVDEKFVNVKFKVPGVPHVPNMFLAEGRDITRVRNYKNITPINETIYLQKYDIIDSFDTAPDLRNLATEADMTKITHFIFEVQSNGQTRLLAVENPYFGGK